MENAMELWLFTCQEEWKMEVSGLLLKRKDKLPITKAYIESVMESITDFQLRKVNGI